MEGLHSLGKHFTRFTYQWDLFHAREYGILDHVLLLPMK